jgi:Gpi18-like mannosyltransferase
MLHKLTRLIFGDDRFANRAVLAFAISPASVFFRYSFFARSFKSIFSPDPRKHLALKKIKNPSACYTESLFTALSFAGMYYAASGSDVRACICFAVASFSRSNGAVLAGYREINLWNIGMCNVHTVARLLGMLRLRACCGASVPRAKA